MVEAAVERRPYPRTARLRQPAQFKALTAHAQRRRGVVFELRYRTNETTNARLGMVIPKRLARRAVLRNLVKRQVRESFRTCLPALPHIDILVRLVKPIAPGLGEDRGQQRRRWRADIDILLAGLAV